MGMIKRNKNGRCCECGRYVCHEIHEVYVPRYSAPRPISDRDYVRMFVDDDDMDVTFGIDSTYDPFTNSVIGDR